MFYDLLKPLRPYFYSLREIENNVSLDVILPKTWKYDYAGEEMIQIIPQDQNDKNNLVSFIAPLTPQGYTTVFSVVKGIIRYNVDNEEKERLFQQKISELQELFARESLESLKNINFINKIDNDGSKDNTGDELAGQRNEERPDGNPGE